MIQMACTKHINKHVLNLASTFLYIIRYFDKNISQNVIFTDILQMLSTEHTNKQVSNLARIFLYLIHFYAWKYFTKCSKLAFSWWLPCLTRCKMPFHLIPEIFNHTNVLLNMSKLLSWSLKCLFCLSTKIEISVKFIQMFTNCKYCTCIF